MSVIDQRKTALKIESVVSLDMENVNIYKFYQGIYLRDCNNGIVKNVSIEYCFKGLIGLFRVPKESPVNLFNFVNCGFRSNEFIGINLEYAHNVKFDSCSFEGNLGDALVISYFGNNGKNSLNIINCYFESNRHTDFYYLPQRAGTINLIGNTFNRTEGLAAGFKLPHEYSCIIINLKEFYAEGNTNYKHHFNMIGNGFMYTSPLLSDKGEPNPITILYGTPPESANSTHLKITDTNHYDYGSSMEQ